MIPFRVPQVGKEKIRQHRPEDLVLRVLDDLVVATALGEHVSVQRDPQLSGQRRRVAFAQHPCLDRPLRPLDHLAEGFRGRSCGRRRAGDTRRVGQSRTSRRTGRGCRARCRGRRPRTAAGRPVDRRWARRPRPGRTAERNPRPRSPAPAPACRRSACRPPSSRCRPRSPVVAWTARKAPPPPAAGRRPRAVGCGHRTLQTPCQHLITALSSTDNAVIPRSRDEQPLPPGQFRTGR